MKRLNIGFALAALVLLSGCLVLHTTAGSFVKCNQITAEDPDGELLENISVTRENASLLFTMNFKKEATVSIRGDAELVANKGDKVLIQRSFKGEKKFYDYDEQWVMTQSPTVLYYDDKNCRRTFRSTTNKYFTAESENRSFYTGSEMMYYGDVGGSLEKTTQDGRLFRVVNASMAWERKVNRTMDDLLLASQYDFGADVQSDVVMFIRPHEDSRYVGASKRGVKYGEDNIQMIIRANTGRKGNPDESLPVHEYIHTTQSFNYRYEHEMFWIMEGSANYYGSIIPAVNYDSMDRSDVTGELSKGKHSDATLLNVSTWEEDTSIHYERGARVVAKLDKKIQEKSNKSFLTVFRWMNQQPSKPTYKEFRRYVVSITDEDTGEWLDTVVTEDTRVTIEKSDIPKRVLPEDESRDKISVPSLSVDNVEAVKKKVTLKQKIRDNLKVDPSGRLYNKTNNDFD